jgi:hypothetical protein
VACDLLMSGSCPVVGFLSCSFAIIVPFLNNPRLVHQNRGRAEAVPPANERMRRAVKHVVKATSVLANIRHSGLRCWPAKCDEPTGKRKSRRGNRRLDLVQRGEA